jgi:hypothetical protein
MALVIGTAVLVTVALAMALVGPSRYADTAKTASVRAVTATSSTQSGSQSSGSGAVERRWGLADPAEPTVSGRA